MKRGKRERNDGDEYSFGTKERDKQINERGACVNDTVSETTREKQEELELTREGFSKRRAPIQVKSKVVRRRVCNSKVHLSSS